jgi:hypothetical protein
MVALEIRQAIRSLWRAPLFASVVVLLLALGIGSNALIFTAVDALLLRPLPVAHAEQIVRLGIRRSPTHTFYEHPYVYAQVLREGAHAFSHVFASGPMEMALASGNRVESITGNTASGNYFSALGLRPALGRLFTSADEEGHAPVAVLSYGFWKRAFAGREDVIGTNINLRGASFTVVGVLQPGFVDLDLENRPDVWVPISAWTLLTGEADIRHASAQLFMRLRGGVSIAQAEAEVRSLYPDFHGPCRAGTIWNAGLFGIPEDRRNRHPRRRRRFRRTNRQDDWAGCCLSRGARPRARSGCLRCVLARGGGVALRRRAIGRHVGLWRRGVPDRRYRLRDVVPGRPRRGDPAVAGVAGRVTVTGAGRQKPGDRRNVFQFCQTC